jgi:hemin uptake protein HemP
MKDDSTARTIARLPGSHDAGPACTAGTGRMPRTVDSQTLLQDQSTLFIRHQGEVYRLQQTRQGKLILTK